LASALNVQFKKGATSYCSWVVVGIVLFFGRGLAVRHLYLQKPSKRMSYSGLPGLSYMFDVFPWQEIMQAHGDGKR